MSCKNLVVLVIFLLSSLSIYASEYYIYISYNRSAKILILKKEADGSIGRFGIIERQEKSYLITFDDAPEQSHYILSHDSQKINIKYNNNTMAYINNCGDLYDSNNNIITQFRPHYLGYDFEDKQRHSLGRLEFGNGFAKIKVYGSADQHKVSMLSLMAAKKYYNF